MKGINALALVLPLLVVGCGAAEEDTAAVAEPVMDAVVADPGHYSVEFENDALQVIRITYGAGEQ